MFCGRSFEVQDVLIRMMSAGDKFISVDCVLHLPATVVEVVESGSEWQRLNWWACFLLVGVMWYFRITSVTVTRQPWPNSLKLLKIFVNEKLELHVYVVNLQIWKYWKPIASIISVSLWECWLTHFIYNGWLSQALSHQLKVLSRSVPRNPPCSWKMRKDDFFIDLPLIPLTIGIHLSVFAFHLFACDCHLQRVTPEPTDSSDYVIIRRWTGNEIKKSQNGAWLLSFTSPWRNCNPRLSWIEDCRSLCVDGRPWLRGNQSICGTAESNHSALLGGVWGPRTFPDEVNVFV